MSDALSQPGVFLLLSVFCLAGLFHLAVLALARRRFMLDDDGIQWTVLPELMAVAGIVLPLATAIFCWRSAFANFQSAIIAWDAAEKAHMLAHGLQVYLNTSASLSIGLGALVCLGGLALGLVLSARLRGERALLRRVALLGPIAAGAVLSVLMFSGAVYSTALIRAFSAVAGVDPSNRAILLRQALEEAGMPFDGAADATALAGLLLFLSVSVLLMLAPTERRSSGVSAYRFVAGSLVISVALTAETWSTYQENTSPALPFSATGEILAPVPYVSSPEVTGIDELERAPIVSVSNEKLAIEMMDVTPETLGEKLEEMRTVYEMMHPGQPFHGGVILLVDRDVAGARLMSVIEGARSAGYENGYFAFVKTGHIDRPRLGRIALSRTSAAFVELDPEADVKVTITVGDNERFDEIARRIVAARAQRQSTKLMVSR